MTDCKLYDFCIPLNDHTLLFIDHDELLRWIQNYYKIEQPLSWVKNFENFPT